MDELREAIARGIWDCELRLDGLSRDPECAWPGLIDPRTWRHEAIAGYLIEAIPQIANALREGPDLSAMLVDVAEDRGIPKVELWDGDEESFGWRATVITHRQHRREYYGFGKTPEAALAAAREAAVG